MVNVFAQHDTRVPLFQTPHAFPQSRSVAPLRSEGIVRWGALHERMVERYAPPSVLLNADCHVIHSSEHAGHYLRYPAGEPTTNIFALLPDELAIELRTALYAAGKGENHCAPSPYRSRWRAKPETWSCAYIQPKKRPKSYRASSWWPSTKWRRRKPRPVRGNRETRPRAPDRVGSGETAPGDGD
jgi:hypothetical protein